MFSLTVTDDGGSGDNHTLRNATVWANGGGSGVNDNFSFSSGQQIFNGDAITLTDAVVTTTLAATVDRSATTDNISLTSTAGLAEGQSIIINDGSKDHSWEIIRHYASQDSRITPITQENIGLTKSLNKGIWMAGGQYIARQDADDVSLPNRLERQLPWLQEHGYGMCCSRTWILEQQRVSPGWSYWLPKGLLMLRQNPFVHSTYLLNTSRLRQMGGYDERYCYSQDYELMTRWLTQQGRVKYLRECLCLIRKPASAISQSKHSEQRAMGQQIQQHWRKQVREAPWLLFR